MKPSLHTAGLAILALGIAVAVASSALWFAGGMNMGWTKTYIEIMKTDEVTGIEYPDKVSRFVPGVDFLVPGIGAGIVCIFVGAAILRAHRKTYAP